MPKTRKMFFPLGIKVTYDLSRKAGDRVVSVQVVCTECEVPSFSPLQPENIYKIILSSFFINGGDGYTMIKANMLERLNYGMFSFIMIIDASLNERCTTTASIEFYTLKLLSVPVIAKVSQQ